jgi:hypothetical protein
VSRPPSKAAVTFLAPTAGNENGRRLSSVMAGGLWPENAADLCKQPNPTLYQCHMLRLPTQNPTFGRVEEGRGGLRLCQSPRFPSPLIKPDVRVSRIRFSDWLHRQTHGGGPMCLRRRSSTPSSPNSNCSGPLTAAVN